MLALEQSLNFKRMEVGLLSEGCRWSKFTLNQLPAILKSLESGKTDWLQLSPSKPGDDWVRSYEDHVHVSWDSAIPKPLERALSPVEERFGRSIGSLVVTYPVSRFAIGSESLFQRRLLRLVKALTLEYGSYWSFINEDFRPRRPASVGADDVFLESLNRFPLTSFDADLHGAGAIYFKEFVKGAFWTNFLNPVHVERLGGIRKINAEHPSPEFKRVGEDRILLQVGASPLPQNYETAAHDYQRLRRFLRPILLETPEDRQKFQVSIIGSWKPPGYDPNWKTPSSPSR